LPDILNWGSSHLIPAMMVEIKSNIQLIYFIIFLVIFSGCIENNQVKKTDNEISGDLIIFHAGSLSVPFKQIADTFEKIHPNVDVFLESAGSVSCARKIIDLNRKCDIIASADYKVIDKLLIPDYASWNIRFAGNEMVIAYTKKAKYAEKINTYNWYDILLNQDVIYGRSSPDQDPCGYRAVITMKLAEVYYNKPGLTEQLLEKNRNYIRPKEVDLVALLETNSIDYSFNYRSVAEQHQLEYLKFPAEINLKDPSMNDIYKNATVDISGKKPGEKINIEGESMVYGISITDNAENKEAAITFLEFLLAPDKGMAIIEKNGQSSLIPHYTTTYSQLPETLKKYASGE